MEVRLFRWHLGTDPDVYKVWDNKKTLRQNYEKLGLVSDTNKMEEAKAPEHPLIGRDRESF